MYRIGIDVGSTYTKFCVMNDNGIIETLFMEKSPIRQKDYFEKKIIDLKAEYGEAEIVSCGYGKKNIDGTKSINELTALARGVFLQKKQDGTVLDIGGQDTKIIVQQNGNLKDFFLNDKCAAGSGLFLSNTLDLLNKNFDEIDLLLDMGDTFNLSASCAVFAQSEIVELIADNYTESEILIAVVRQILTKARSLLAKMDTTKVFFTGGLSQIKGIDKAASEVLGVECVSVENGSYLAAIGCVAR